MRPVLALVLFVGVTVCVQAADDEKYTSKEGKFAIQFPAGSKVKTATQKAGGISLNLASVESDGKTYVTMYTELPEAATKLPPKTLLDAMEKGAVDKSGAKLDSSKDITFGKDKLPGRESVMDKDGNKITARLILADMRVYMVMVGGPKDFATSKDATKFLDSFEITK